MRACALIVVAVISIALAASAASAQDEAAPDVENGFLTITVECGERESVTVANGGSPSVVLRGIGSSPGSAGGIEVDLGGVVIGPDVSRTFVLEGAGALGEIFEDGAGEVATVYFHRWIVEVPCGPSDRGSFAAVWGTHGEPPARPTEPGAMPELPDSGAGGLAPGALTAVLVSSTSAQDEPEFHLVDDLIIIQVECGARERIQIANGLDRPLTLQGISSSKDRTDNPEIAFNVRIAPGQKVERELGATGEIFEDGAGETASVYLSLREHGLVCEGGDKTKPVGFNPHARPEGNKSQPLVSPDMQRRLLEASRRAGVAPSRMPEVGGGGLATGASISVGNAAAGLAMLVGTGYAALRLGRNEKER